MGRLELLDSELIAKIRGIQLKAKHLVTEDLAGEYKSAFRGRGLEFDEVREYFPGDDVRSIDWNVTARMGAPFIKVHRDERELTVMFVVDVSASTHFGSHKRFKNEIAAEVTALLAYSALSSNDKVGLIIFSDKVEHYLPPKKGRGHVWQLIRDILTFDSGSKNTDLNIPLEFLNQVIKKKSVVFLVSDFLSQSYEEVLRLTSRRHDLVVLTLEDPREKKFPNIGFIELEDAESGEVLLLDTSNQNNREEIAGLSGQRREEMKKFFLSNGIDHISLETDVSYMDSVVSFFRLREKRVKFR